MAALVAASLAANLWTVLHHAWLEYGDAEAHLHIARRLLDSHRPGMGQLGSVWLPLPHLLLAPFAAVTPWWRSGFAGAIPSSVCYGIASLLLYRLARRWLATLPALIALALFALNPNLLYLQTTPMTEPLFLSTLVGAVWLMERWRSELDCPTAAMPHGRHEHKPDTGGQGAAFLWPLMITLFAAAWTRYDGWILGFAIWLWMALALLRRHALLQRRFVLASFALLAAPVLWMVYNRIYFGDWLDFLRGPYSASAIEARTSHGLIPPHPGWHNPWVSAIFFWHASTGDVFARSQVGWLFLLLALGGLALHGYRLRRSQGAARASLAIGLLLWFPLPFYAYSVAWGSVPIFLPDWWPHSYYNTRYGMEMLPAFALAVGFAVQGLLHGIGGRLSNPRQQPAADSSPVAALQSKGHRQAAVLLGMAMACLVLANLLQMLVQGPIVYVEATRNFAARGAYTQQLASALASLYRLDPQALTLMDTSDFPTIVPLAGFTYRHTLNESDKQYFQAALAAPAAHVDIVLAFDGDVVARAVRLHPEGLRCIGRFSVPGQPGAALWISMRSPLNRQMLSPTVQ